MGKPQWTRGAISTVVAGHLNRASMSQGSSLSSIRTSYPRSSKALGCRCGWEGKGSIWIRDGGKEEGGREATGLSKESAAGAAKIAPRCWGWKQKTNRRAWSAPGIESTQRLRRGFGGSLPLCGTREAPSRCPSPEGEGNRFQRGDAYRGGKRSHEKVAERGKARDGVSPVRVIGMCGGGGGGACLEQPK